MMGKCQLVAAVLRALCGTLQIRVDVFLLESSHGRAAAVHADVCSTSGSLQLTVKIRLDVNHNIVNYSRLTADVLLQCFITSCMCSEKLNDCLR